jgi:hypothetical protein
VPANTRPDPKKLASGLFFLGVGVVAVVWAQEYPLGTVLRMGPGYFPLLLGCVLVVLGAISIIQALRAGKSIPTDLPPGLSLEPLVLIVLSIVSFGLLIGRFGLIPALFAAIFLACLRRAISRPLEILLIFAVLATFCGLVFVYLLGMPIKLFAWPG